LVRAAGARASLSLSSHEEVAADVDATELHIDCDYVDSANKCWVLRSPSKWVRDLLFDATSASCETTWEPTSCNLGVPREDVFRNENGWKLACKAGANCPPAHPPSHQPRRHPSAPNEEPVSEGGQVSNGARERNMQDLIP
jgi:hypothetical protein